ncbi:YLP motif-containing protein 1-like isoform X2 [Mangifera indica]|uniref:YLP motif-containing protein 1-like isoform X2 n=1 Tax=Mangifera indica TaxID=29780 RepID=UPI001CFC214E|nr:YLP motif-containing protein 1-like isoform X2 [Mangifera indica]
MPYLVESQSFPLKQLCPEKPKVVNALQLFKLSHRATRPDHIVIILRRLPGSGKSYLAKLLPDLEVENGGDAPRIHSMDNYFMTEVEKIEEGDVSKSSSSIRSKKLITKKVMEYCYEPEMEETYRSSMLKAFKRTLEEGNFTL